MDCGARLNCPRVERDRVRPWLWPISLALLAGFAATLAAGRLDWECLDSLPRNRFPRLIQVAVCFASAAVGLATLGCALRPRQDRFRALLLLVSGLGYLLAIFAASMSQILHRQDLEDRLILLSLGALLAGTTSQIAFHAAFGAALACVTNPTDDRARRFAEHAGVIVIVGTLAVAGVWTFHLRDDPPLSAGVAISRGAAGLAALATIAAGFASVRIGRPGAPSGKRPRRVASWWIFALAVTAAAELLGTFLVYWDHVRPQPGPGIFACLVETSLLSMPARYLPGLSFALGVAEDLRLAFERRTS